MGALKETTWRLFSKNRTVLPAVLGAFFATGLMVTLAVAAGASLAPSVSPSGSGSSAPLVTGPPAPLDIPGTAGALAGLSVAENWPTVVVGEPGVTVSGQPSAGAIVVQNVLTGARTTLDNPVPYEYDEFGFSVALSPTALVVGAPGDGADAASAVYVYNPTTLELEATLSDTNFPKWGLFGYSVATSGNYVVVGAIHDNSSGTTGSGAAYVFSTTDWLAGTLTSPSPAAGGDFGYSVAISGSTIVVGAPGESPGGVTSAGRAYEFDATTGYLVRTFTSPWPVVGSDTEIGFLASYGASVAVSGTIVAIGAAQETGPGHVNPNESGDVYEYNLSNASVTVLTSPHPQLGGCFGASVALGPVRLIVGAVGETIRGVNFSGAAYAFNVALGSEMMSSFVSPDPRAEGAFGQSVAVSAGQVVVGAPVEGEFESGNAYVFRSPATTLTGGVPPASFETFGDSVSASGPFVVVGAPEALSTGAAWVFDTVTSTSQLLRSPWGEGGDWFGESVAISGNLVAVGAPYWSSSTYSDIGNVWVYNALTGAVVANLSVPVGYQENGMEFGYSVGISGTTVVVGAPTYDDRAGIVFVCNETSAVCGSGIQPTTQFNALFGLSVAVNGSVAVSGAPGENLTVGPTTYAGAGALWTINTTTLSSLEVACPHPQSCTNFGAAVALDSSELIVGAPFDNVSGMSYVGQAFVLNRATDSVVQTLVSPNPLADGEFGAAVGIAGTTAVVGAPWEDTSSSQYGPIPAAGNAYVFSAVTGAPSLAFPAPGGVSGGELGASVAISGSTVVFGAPYDSPTGSSVGAAYIL